MCADWFKLHGKSAKVYLISGVSENKVFDSQPGITRLNAASSAATPLTSLKSFRDSLVVLDDLEGLTGSVSTAIEDRHENISVILCSQLSSYGAQTRIRMLRLIS